MRIALTSVIVLTFVFAFALTANAQCGDANCATCVQALPAPVPVVADCGCGQSACSSCQPTVIASPCGCKKAGCLKCLSRLRKRCSGGCAQCPKCEGDVCELKLDKGKVKKSGWKTEQKSVCVPTVRMPWQKCCPPGTSKSRLVTVLKKHTYECESCSYKWSIQKPEPVEAAKPDPVIQMGEPTPVYDSYIPENSVPATDVNTPITPTETYTPPQQIPTQLPTKLIPEQNIVPTPNAVPQSSALPQSNVVPQSSVVPSMQTSSRVTHPWRVQNN